MKIKWLVVYLADQCTELERENRALRINNAMLRLPYLEADIRSLVLKWARSRRHRRKREAAQMVRQAATTAELRKAA